MKILQIESKDVYITLELSVKEVEQILMFLGNSGVEYNSKENPELEQSVEFVSNGFFKTLDSVLESIKRGGYGT